MRILAIETATEALSIALFEDGGLLGWQHELIGRGHAEQLVPAIAALPDKGRADEIRVSLGPGSFTGTRIGLAAARALALAWGANARGFPTLALVAAVARNTRGAQAVDVAMTGGHGEIFLQSFDAQGLPRGVHRSLSPADAAAALQSPLVAGSKALALADMAGGAECIDMLPDARFATALPESVLTHALSPIYGRPPDARPAAG